jgi:hypothetical protein
MAVYVNTGYLIEHFTAAKKPATTFGNVKADVLATKTRLSGAAISAA